jgi:hypothetical protein
MAGRNRKLSSSKCGDFKEGTGPVRYYTLLEVAKRLRLGELRRTRGGVSSNVTDDERRVRSARHLVKTGQIRGLIIGGRLLVREDDLRAYEEQALNGGRRFVSGRSDEGAIQDTLSRDCQHCVDDNSSRANRIDESGDHSVRAAECNDHSGCHW